MQINIPILFVEINKNEYIFIVGDKKENGEFKLIHSQKATLNGIHKNKIISFDIVYKDIKENIYSIEQNYNCVFKEVIVIINNFNCSLINFSGFKRLNGSQLKKENITYILNTLKAKITETEEQKNILHIFNSKYLLDKSKIDNLPIGLFGNFYSQELSFFLIDINDLKNLKKIFNNCNLKIKKIISKNFLEGTKIIDNFPNVETFLRIEISEDEIEIIYFENSALKFNQNFKFGSNLILNDISKVIALKLNIVKKILTNSDFSKGNLEDSYIEKDFFLNENFRKIKKKLILDIAKARIEEIAEITVFKNINLQSFLSKDLKIFIKFTNNKNIKSVDDIYKIVFSKENKFDLNFLEDFDLDETYKSADKLVQFGWKKEAVPVVQEKKSLIARFFDLFFN